MTRKTGEEVIIVGMKSGEAYNGRKALCDERAADRKVSVMRQKLLAMNMQLNARFSSDNLKDALVKTHGNVDGAIDALLESKRGTVEEEERRKKRERATTDAENEVIVLN
jgi:predicted N-formylglutamate amidohydrolase